MALVSGADLLQGLRSHTVHTLANVRTLPSMFTKTFMLSQSKPTSALVKPMSLAALRTTASKSTFAFVVISPKIMIMPVFVAVSQATYMPHTA